ncbi:hypothetical protein [Paenibacillus alvei]|uniref:Uncharacterized protein n=1 Tax=Paenibacillus alvei TaxID=44250 RepID=A0AAP7DJ89_PAEAL|nr:hypothetical protein [Paenibacillus alvei]NOJ71406.1 hypothetical protein [Paenibacillus alvei]
MEPIPMLKCMIDLTKPPVKEIVEVINAVMDAHPNSKTDILGSLDEIIGQAYAQALAGEEEMI